MESTREGSNSVMESTREGSNSVMIWVRKRGRCRGNRGDEEERKGFSPVTTRMTGMAMPTASSWRWGRADQSRRVR